MIDKSKIEKIKATGGAGNKPIRFRFNYEGRKYDFEFETLDGYLQGNGFMGTRTTPAKLVYIRNGMNCYGSVETYKLKSSFCEDFQKDIAVWLLENE